MDAWRREWQAASLAPDPATAAHLASTLASLGLPEEEIEIEREMLAALDEVLRLRASLADGGLPLVETGHRVVGHDSCHFSVTASMPDDPAQPSGHLFFTGARAIFAGGGRSHSLAWHTVIEVLQQERDIILVKHDRETFYRFRCNVYADALSGVLLARTLAAQIRKSRSV